MKQSHLYNLVNEGVVDNILKIFHTRQIAVAELGKEDANLLTFGGDLEVLFKLLTEISTDLIRDNEKQNDETKIYGI